MNSALLSRFDLVFILLDKPDEQMDRFLSDHIMKMHAGGGKKDTGFRNAWGMSLLSSGCLICSDSE